MEKLNEVKQALKYLEIDAKAYADNFSASMIVSTKNILAIAEAFRDLEQRAEAAEAIVSDVKEVISLLTEREWAEHCTKTKTGKLLEELITELHDDASTAYSLTELVPDEIPGAFVYHGAKGAFDAGKSAGWNACRDEVLKNIEERESEKA
jgi:hypothetical protein